MHSVWENFISKEAGFSIILYILPKKVQLPTNVNWHFFPKVSGWSGTALLILLDFQVIHYFTIKEMQLQNSVKRAYCHVNAESCRQHFISFPVVTSQFSFASHTVVQGGHCPRGCGVDAHLHPLSYRLADPA